MEVRIVTEAKSTPFVEKETGSLGLWNTSTKTVEFVFRKEPVEISKNFSQAPIYRLKKVFETNPMKKECSSKFIKQGPESVKKRFDPFNREA